MEDFWLKMYLKNTTVEDSRQLPIFENHKNKK